MPQDRKGDRVKARETADGPWLYGTVLHDSHGVEAYVRWDSGKTGLYMWSGLFVCDEEETSPNG